MVRREALYDALAPVPLVNRYMCSFSSPTLCVCVMGPLSSFLADIAHVYATTVCFEVSIELQLLSIVHLFSYNNFYFIIFITCF